jgi:hypothetical protein
LEDVGPAPHLMASLPAGPHPEHNPEMRPTSAADELERLKRLLILDLFLRRGPFWNAVLDVRTRWQIEPSTEVPPPEFGRSIYPIPEATEWKNDQWVQWHKDRAYLRKQALPQVNSHQLDDKFFEASVLYVPPDTALLEYADRFPLLATALFNEGARAGLTKQEVLSMPHTVAPAIKRICDPGQLLEVQMEFVNKLLGEVNERHLKPRGLNLESMIADVQQKTPLKREHLVKMGQLQQQTPLYIAVGPHIHQKDVDQAYGIREVYRRKTGASGNPSSHYFRVRDDNRWVQRATDYDAHRQAQIQKAEDEAFARVAGEIAEKEAISVERMRVEMANFVDDVGPEVRRRIREILEDEDRELSLSSLVQVQRVVLDTVKLLDRGEGDYEPPGYTDKELEELLGEGGTSDEDA